MCFALSVRKQQILRSPPQRAELRWGPGFAQDDTFGEQFLSNLLNAVLAGAPSVDRQALKTALTGLRMHGCFSGYTF
jgi:hypothetical protein